MRRRNRKPGGTTGLLRVHSPSAGLVPRLRAGDIAVLDQIDLDAATAQTLVDRGVVAVVNASQSSSGRYPNVGPRVLLDAGIPLLDQVGGAVLTHLRDGRPARLCDDVLYLDDAEVARGVRQDDESVAAAERLAQAGAAAQLSDLLGGAARFVVDERQLLLDREGLPALRARIAGRHVLVVGPAYGAEVDLRRLRPYLRRRRPLLVAVDGGGDVLLQAGLRPEVLVGDPATMSDAALCASGEVVLRAGAPGMERVQDLAVATVPFVTRAAAEDMALLLAAEAQVVVMAGLPRTLHELLDRGRDAAASSLVTRMALSGRLLPAHAAIVLTAGGRRRIRVVGAVVVAALAVGGGFGHDSVVHAWQHLIG